MAEILVGDVLAKLRADSTQFTQTLTQAIQQLGRLNQAFTALRQQQSPSQQATAQQVQATTQLTRSAQTATTALGQLRQQTQQVQQAQQQATTTTRAFGSSLQTAFAVAGGIGIATSIGAIVSQMKDLAVQTVQTGTRLESLRASLSALGGGPGVGAQQFQMLVDMAQRLGVALEPLARGWRTLTAAATQAKLPMEDQVRLLDAMSKEARRTGASSDDLGRAILAVGQMASKGKVSMEELRQQLGEALVTALAAAALGMGRTTEELIKLVEAGNVSFVPFAQALTRGFEQMQRSGAAFSEGSREAFNRLANAWTVLQDTIMKGGLNTYLAEVAKNVQNVLEFATKTLAPDPDRVGLRPLTEMGATPDQAKQVAGLERTIASLTRQAANAQNEAHRTQYTEMATRAKEQLEQVMATVRATREQQAAQKAVTDETNKTLDVQARQKAFNDSFVTAQEKIAKAQATFRAEAALAPQRLGDPRGDPAAQQLFDKNLRDSAQKEIDALVTLVVQRGADIKLAQEQRQAVAAVDTQHGQLTQRIEASRDAETARAKAIREAEQAQRKAAQQAIQDEETRQAAIDKVTMSLARQEEEALGTLKAINARFFQDKEERAIDTVTAIQERFPGNEAIQAQAAQTKASLETRDAYLAEVEALKERFTALKQNADAMREQEDIATKFTQDVGERLAALQTPREERLSAQLRRRAGREGVDLTPQLQAQLRLIDEQTRWNTLMDHAGRIGDQAAQTITSGLMRMADGTVAVSEGFRAMAKDILDSMAQIALNETFKTLFGLGLGLLGGAVTGGAGGGALTPFASTPAYQSSLPLTPMFQGAEGLGPINKPTLALIGEGRTNPEYVLNQHQMNSMMSSAMRSGPGAGGQAVTVINVASKEQADVEAARERALGRQVVVNYVLEELGQGSGSRISQVMRSTLR